MLVSGPCPQNEIGRACNAGKGVGDAASRGLEHQDIPADHRTGYRRAERF